MDIGAARYCAKLTAGFYRGREIPARIRAHIDWLSSDHGTEPAAPQPQLSHDDLDLIGVATAARILGVSQRYARRIHADLDGVRIDGNVWVFQRPTVVAYAQAKSERGQHDCA